MGEGVSRRKRLRGMLWAGDLPSGLSLLPQALRAGLADAGSRLIFQSHWPGPLIACLLELSFGLQSDIAFRYF